jgi:mono/diheme cytochrome c family protein
VLRLGLVKPPRDLTNAEFHAQVTDEDLLRIIRVGKNQMPAFGGLMGDEDLRNVIAFIRTLPPGARVPQPPAPPSAQVAPPHRPEQNGTIQ